MSLYGLVTIQSFYLPFALLAISAMLGDWPILEAYGLAAGHLWYFFTDVFPRGRGRCVACRAADVLVPRQTYSRFVRRRLPAIGFGPVGCTWCLRALLQLRAARGSASRTSVQITCNAAPRRALLPPQGARARAQVPAGPAQRAGRRRAAAASPEAAARRVHGSRAAAGERVMADRWLVAKQGGWGRLHSSE